MGLLGKLGLVATAATLNALSRQLGDDAPPSDGGSGAAPKMETKKPPSGRAAASKASAPPDLKELAKWPAQAHRAWKRLDEAARAGTLIQMATRYGADFARSFAGVAKKGGGRTDSHDYVPALPEQNSEYMRAKGYRLAQHGSDGDIAQEWWVHPNGHVVYLQRKLSPNVKAPDVAPPADEPPVDPGDEPPEKKLPPVQPPQQTGSCSKEEQEFLDMARGWMTTASKEASKRSRQWADEQAKLDRMDANSPEYEKAYRAQARKLEKDKAWLEAQIQQLEEAEASILESGCDAKKTFTSDLDALRERGFERDAADMMFGLKKPLHLGPKPLDGESDEDDDGS